MPRDIVDSEVMEPVYYLKCSYEEGFHHSEYLISFNTFESTPESNPLISDKGGTRVINTIGLENRMWVIKRDVITAEDDPKLEKSKGLMKIEGIYQSDMEKSLIGIRNIDGVSRRYIPNSEIVSCKD
jgi:hypothetical protein